MKIDGVYTGQDFEQFILRVFQQQGFQVHDTPLSNDYGADLIVIYNPYVFSIQCKYYEKAVGVKAVQEVIGSLTYYNASFGMVITNSTFTQQAQNLAQTNNVLLVDGDKLIPFAWNNGIKNIIDLFISNCQTKNTIPLNQGQDWLMSDLQIRYKVGKEKILKDFMGNGMPYYRVGREYRFNPVEVMNWEIAVKAIPFGPSGVIELPAFLEYKARLISSLKEAKQNHDKEAVQAIKKEMRNRGISRFS